MKKSKFTEEQIAFALQQADTGISVDEYNNGNYMKLFSCVIYRQRFN